MTAAGGSLADPPPNQGGSLGNPAHGHVGALGNSAPEQNGSVNGSGPGRSVTSGSRSSTTGGTSTASIGSVLARLKPDFPDVTISKIRFLESEGLVTPVRTPAGYRQFSPYDIERLKYVLAAQRDHYLPLKVIKEQLDAVDRGLEPATPSPRLPRAVAVASLPEAAGLNPTPVDVRMNRSELLAETGLTNGDLRELEQYGLVMPSHGGFYDAEAVLTARTVAELLGRRLGASAPAALPDRGGPGIRTDRAAGGGAGPAAGPRRPRAGRHGGSAARGGRRAAARAACQGRLAARTRPLITGPTRDRRSLRMVPGWPLPCSRLPM